MTPEERYILEAIVRRSEALTRLARAFLKKEYSIPNILAFFSWNLMGSLFLACGKDLEIEFLGWFHGNLQKEAGICNLCGKLKDPPDAIACPDCLADFERADAEIDAIERNEP